MGIFLGDLERILAWKEAVEGVKESKESVQLSNRKPVEDEMISRSVFDHVPCR